MHADKFWITNQSNFFGDGLSACKNWFKSPDYNVKFIPYNNLTGIVGRCEQTIKSNGAIIDIVNVSGIIETHCPPKDTVFSGAGLRRNGELFTPPATICISKCLYDFSDAMASQEVRTDGSITTLFYGDAKSLYAQCSVDDKDDIPPPLNPCKTKNDKGEFVDKDYCDAPPDGCPEGYIQGMFNGKKICVKQDKNDKDNCKPTVSDPYKCLPNKPTPESPDQDGNCKPPKVKTMMGTTAYCTEPELPPNPDGSCPKGYVKQTYDGTSICVPDNQRPDGSDNCPLNTTLTTLPDGSKVCRGGNGDDAGGGASEPVGGDGEGGSGDCNPETDFLCKDFDLPNPDDTKLNVSDIQIPDLDENKISWSEQCPADATATFSGKSYSFSYDKACSFLSTYIHPLMVAFGYLSGAFILIGAVRK